MVVVDDDELLSGSTHKTLVKKAKTYTSAQQDTLDRLSLWLKSEGWNCQYSKEMPDLVKYWNKNVPNLRQAGNTDDHSVHLAIVKKRSWSYPAKMGKSCSMVKYFRGKWMLDTVHCARTPPKTTGH